MFFPHCPYETQASLALHKNNFSGSNFFPHCSHETQTSPALQKTIFQALIFFVRMPLVKSANSTLLPRLSLLQIVQMHAIQNDPRPIVV